MSALKYLKSAIMFFVVSVMVAVCASAAYTTTQDGLSTVYTWGWASDNYVVKSLSSIMPNAYIRASYDNVTVYQNGPGIVGGNRLGTYSSALGLKNVLQYDAGAKSYVSEGAGLYYLRNNGEYPCAVFSFFAEDYMSGYANTNALELDGDFSVSFSYLSYFEDYTAGSTSGYIMNKIKETPLVIDVRGGEDYSLMPSVVTSEDIYTSSTGTFRLITLTFVVDLSLSDNLTLIIDGFTVDMYACYDLPVVVSAGSDYEVPFFTRYNMSFSDVEFRTIPTEEAKEALIIANASNDDLITKLGVINEVDREKITYQRVEYDKVSSSTSQLVGMTDFSETLSSQVDLSQKVDILDNGTLVDGVSNMWDIFPWDSQFFVIAISMIAGISLLSLILHGGERAISSSKNNSRSKNNNSRGDDG